MEEREIVVVEYPNGYRARCTKKLADILINKGAVKEVERIKPEVVEQAIHEKRPEKTDEVKPKRSRKK